MKVLKQIGLSLSEDMIKEVDRRKVLISRSDYIRLAIHEKLQKEAERESKNEIQSEK